MSNNGLYDLTPVVLFDVDGTLTAHRRKIKSNVINALLELSELATIGLVTGSPFSLIEEQLEPFFNHKDASITENVDIFPCNGTQHFYWDAVDCKFSCSATHSMRAKLGEECFRKLIISLQELQLSFINEFALDQDIPLCGNFIDYRGSLLNWCPIGRAANFDDRKKFIKCDKNLQIRSCLMKKFKDMACDVDGVVINYGGQTSFDIFPLGWDKTFCLKNYGDADVWFVGDRCKPGGNDYEIFDLLNKKGRAFETTSPTMTVKIISEKIIPQIREFLLSITD